jgi:hypothetical protein
MSLIAALLSQAPQGTDYYHPPKSTNTPFDTLVWTLGSILFLAIMVGAAHTARARENRRLAAEGEAEPTTS